MSTENRNTPAFHGRLNLKQQRKRAKELLKAAKALELQALRRFATRLHPLPEGSPAVARHQI